MVDQPRSPTPKPKRIPKKITLPKMEEGMNKTKSRPLLPYDDKGAKFEAKQPEGTRDSDIKVLERITKRMDRCITAEMENRKAMVTDLKFLAGDQWPADIATQRATDKRPCLTINRLPTAVAQVTNAQRENRPTINISPVGEKTDKEAAKVLRGMVRFIERESHADIAYDTGFFYSVAGGIGYWRLLTEWEDDKSFDQKLVVKRIANPLTVYLDSNRQEPDGSDAKYGFIYEKLTKEEFKSEYPKAQPVPFDITGEGDKVSSWSDEGGIRICEYYEVVEEDATLVEFESGAIHYKDELTEETEALIESGQIVVKQERDSVRKRVDYYKCSKIEILEHTEWLDCEIPIIPCIGTEINVEGKTKLSGVVRHAIDPQRMYNYWATSETERVALAPQAPYLIAEGQDEGYEKDWLAANRKPFATLKYRPMTLEGHPVPPPIRIPPPEVPQGIVAAKQAAAQDVMNTTGIKWDPSYMGPDMRESGKMIREQRRNSDIGAYHYEDNLGRALKRTGEIMVRMIPKLYDRRRIMTIIREDDSEEAVVLDPTAPKASTQITSANGQEVTIFNPNVGKYGVTVDIGASYATKRIEASESMMEFMASVPNLAPHLADIVVGEMDWPGAEKFQARLESLMPPELLMKNMKGVPPQARGLVTGLSKELNQHKQVIQQMGKALQDKTESEKTKRQKIERDYEAKILMVIEKAEANKGYLTLEAVRMAMDAAAKENEPEKLNA